MPSETLPPPLASPHICAHADDLVPVRWVQDGGALLRNGVLLSPRQIHVLAALGHGCSNREIAARLYLAESTVRTNVSHLGQQLQMNRILLALLWDRIARTSRAAQPATTLQAGPT